VIQDITNDGGSVYFAMVLNCQHVVHSSSQSVIIPVTLSLIFSGQVEVVSCSYIAGMLVCCAEWHMWMCMLCRLIIVNFMGGQLLVFDWARLANFLITHDRLVGNKVTNTICQSWVSHAQIHLHCYSAPSPLVHIQKAKNKVSVSVTPKSWLSRNDVPS